MGLGSGGSFHVEPSALESVLEILADFEKRCEEFVAEVDRQVNALHVDWDGVTATAHLQAQKKWVAGAVEMRTALSQLHGIVKQAHSNYGAAALANTAMWQR